LGTQGALLEEHHAEHPDKKTGRMAMGNDAMRAPGQIMVPLCHTMALLAKEKCPLPENNCCMRPPLQNTARTEAFKYPLQDMCLALIMTACL
jgi:hypothetical protein